MGFDPSGKYLLTISHSGRGLFSAATWQRIARDRELAYPENGFGIGIGPVANEMILVTEMNYETEELCLITLDGTHKLEYDAGTISIIDVD
ncbi:MAG: hypothetical protein AAFY57_06140 [Cyanobacteria bacterium J06642_2]